MQVYWQELVLPCLFIAFAFFTKGHTEIQDEAKFAILVASAISGFSGYFFTETFSQKENKRFPIIKKIFKDKKGFLKFRNPFLF